MNMQYKSRVLFKCVQFKFLSRPKNRTYRSSCVGLLEQLSLHRLSSLYQHRPLDSWLPTHTKDTVCHYMSLVSHRNYRMTCSLYSIYSPRGYAALGAMWCSGRHVVRENLFPAGLCMTNSVIWLPWSLWINISSYVREAVMIVYMFFFSPLTFTNSSLKSPSWRMKARFFYT